MPADYTYTDLSGVERTITNVLDQVALTSVETNVTAGTENRVTVNSTANLYPGMAFSCPDIPMGAFIHGIRSATVIDLWATAWDQTLGIWTTNAANANATFAATGLLAKACGFCPRTMVTLTYAMGIWRNQHRLSTSVGAWTTGSGAVGAGVSSGVGQAFVPSAQTISAGLATITAGANVVTDELMATPLKRHNGEPWGVYILVSTGGHQSVVQAIPGKEILYAGPSA